MESWISWVLAAALPGAALAVTGYYALQARALDDELRRRRDLDARPSS